MNTWALLVVAACSANQARAQLENANEAVAQCVFAGTAKRIAVTLHNPGEQIFQADIRARIFQASSATVVQICEVPWKKLSVLPGQTVLESAQLDFPAVKEKTKFLIQYIENTNYVIAKTEVLAFPTNLLSELKPLLGEDTLGVLDPNDELKPLLRQNGVAFVDLGQTTMEDFSGRLAILGPFRSQAQLPEDVAKRTQTMAKNGAAVLWLQPPPVPRDPLRPSYYSVCVGTNAIVIVQFDVVAGLADNPQSQLNLIYCCKLALNPQPPALPDLSPQP